MPELGISEVINICRASEISRTQVKELRSEVQANSIKKVVPIYKKAPDESSSRSGNAVYLCKKCNTKHEARNCPAFGKRCLNCNKLNHYKIGCKLRKRGSMKINEIAEASEQEVENVGNLFTNSITTVQFKNEVSDPTCNLIKNVHGVTDVWTHTICSENNYFIEFKLDSGSQVNTLPINMYNQLNLCKIKMRDSKDVRIKELIEKEVIENFEEDRNTLRKNAKEQILKMQDENKKGFNKRRKEAFNYAIGDVAIKRTQQGPGTQLNSQYIGPYRITKVKPGNTYDVMEKGTQEGPTVTSSCAEYMKRWIPYDDSSEADDQQDGRI
ncbi:hypothetical protein FQR65_LT14088 [Abscondita terminalis]|nr:hypothetical protein FQR65_LT14088 [Abscondita terminalis]